MDARDQKHKRERIFLADLQQRYSLAVIYLRNSDCWEVLLPVTQNRISFETDLCSYGVVGFSNQGIVKESDGFKIRFVVTFC